MTIKRLGDTTNPTRLRINDDENTSFAPQSFNLTNATVGFDAGEQRVEVPEGHHRFSRPKSKDEIPQESLAERLRANRQGD